MPIGESNVTCVGLRKGREYGTRRSARAEHEHARSGGIGSAVGAQRGEETVRVSIIANEAPAILEQRVDCADGPGRSGTAVNEGDDCFFVRNGHVEAKPLRLAESSDQCGQIFRRYRIRAVRGRKSRSGRTPVAERPARPCA